MKDVQLPDDAADPVDDLREMYGQRRHERPSTPGVAVREAYGPAQHGDGDHASDAQLVAWTVGDRPTGWVSSAVGVRRRTTFPTQPSAGPRKAPA
ncbi:hypothetical protein [Halomicrococcus gelatinilyticus]|uniref:hypothetical protein n=1 Tax=Halomicrococcus gelatinilyticus TaxID=1702103 RepID=UPI002E0E2C74